MMRKRNSSIFQKIVFLHRYFDAAMIRVLLFVLCFVGHDNLIDDHADPDFVKAELIRYLEEDDFDKTVGYAKTVTIE